MKIFRNWNRRDLLKALVKNLLLVLGIAYLFYGSLIAAIPGIILIIPMLRRDREKSEQKRQATFAVEFREALRSMRTAMHSGYAIENAMKEAVGDLIVVYGEEAAIVKEFQYMNNQLALQIPVEEVWQECAERSNVDEVRLFSDIFKIAKRSGGDMIAIMDHTVEAIGDKLEVEQELETVMASQKMEWKIMTLIPFFIIFYMKLSFSEFMDRMYGNLTGIIVMSIALIIMIVAYVCGEKITNIGM